MTLDICTHLAPALATQGRMRRMALQPCKLNFVLVLKRRQQRSKCELAHAHPLRPPSLQTYNEYRGLDVSMRTEFSPLYNRIPSLVKTADPTTNG